MYVEIYFSPFARWMIPSKNFCVIHDAPLNFTVVCVCKTRSKWYCLWIWINKSDYLKWDWLATRKKFIHVKKHYFHTFTWTSVTVSRGFVFVCNVDLMFVTTYKFLHASHYLQSFHVHCSLSCGSGIKWAEIKVHEVIFVKNVLYVALLLSPLPHGLYKNAKIINLEWISFSSK